MFTSTWSVISRHRGEFLWISRFSKCEARLPCGCQRGVGEALHCCSVLSAKRCCNANDSMRPCKHAAIWHKAPDFGGQACFLERKKLQELHSQKNRIRLPFLSFETPCCKYIWWWAVMTSCHDPLCSRAGRVWLQRKSSFSQLTVEGKQQFAVHIKGQKSHSLGRVYTLNFLKGHASCLVCHPDTPSSRPCQHEHEFAGAVSSFWVLAWNAADG